MAWGIAQYGLLYPHAQLNYWTVRDILVLPYFQMYPELYSREAIQSPPYDMIREGECSDDPLIYRNYTALRCADKRTNWIVLLLLMAYILITNLLLFNLLIAIFTSLFEDIQGFCFSDFINSSPCFYFVQKICKIMFY